MGLGWIFFHFFAASHHKMAFVAPFEVQKSCFQRLDGFSDHLRKNENGFLSQHQAEALRFAYDWYRMNPNNRVCCIVCPTGTGESGIATCLPYVMEANRCLVISPNATITNQLSDAFTGGKQYEKAFLVKRGILKRDTFVNQAAPTEFVVKTRADVESDSMLSYNLIVINAHKFPAAWLQKFPMKEFDLIIVNEAHLFPAGLLDGIVGKAQSCGKNVIFLTASPWQSDSQPVVDPSVPLAPEWVL